ncbi:DUF4352 domain-containing protein [Nocardiopsis sp. NRRL B-16309]|uniref:DUF4352 domain-containing protein n=1 Tax=Nocardiopsis sp. NRRL B-16309 TaxID=1519494 RepID=UPI0006AE43F4|nr:DUF4352 domain-containing protein [Nocardiopsis sp. NRRL B-16309]KOX17697.1 hypothetical protein ADL05_08630 [Nocardiopsis sp. NRRL B-16309]
MTEGRRDTRWPSTFEKDEMHDPGPIPQYPLFSPAPRKKSPWLWIGLGCGGLSVLTVLALVVALALVVTDDDRGGTFAVGDRFEVRNVHYTIRGVHPGIPMLGDAIDNARPVEHDAFVVVVLRVTNESFLALDLDMSDFALYSGGTAYTPSAEAGTAALFDSDFGFRNDAAYGTVNTREVRDLPLVFDAPGTDITHMTVTPEANPRLMVTVDLYS